jgi:hypothetical protein
LTLLPSICYERQQQTKYLITYDPDEGNRKRRGFSMGTELVNAMVPFDEAGLFTKNEAEL